jgi:hypothetical protein
LVDPLRTIVRTNATSREPEAAMLDNIGVYEFFDGIVNAVNGERRD